jgi:hypothetical protein
MGKSIRDHRKNSADSILALMDTVITSGYKVRWMGPHGIVEKDFPTHYEALTYSRRINTAGCVIIPL